MQISDEDVHRLHFNVRDATTGGVRSMARYLDRLDDIRRIQSYLVSRARREGIAVVENANVERSIDEVVGLVIDSAQVVPA
jgi:2-phosphoglycerate kinase